MGTGGRGDSARSTPKARDLGGPPPYLLRRRWRRRLLGPAVCSAGSWSLGGVRCASGGVGRARTGAALEAGRAAGRSAVGRRKTGSRLPVILCPTRSVVTRRKLRLGTRRAVPKGPKIVRRRLRSSPERGWGQLPGVGNLQCKAKAVPECL